MDKFLLTKKLWALVQTLPLADGDHLPGWNDTVDSQGIAPWLGHDPLSGQQIPAEIACEQPGIWQGGQPAGQDDERSTPMIPWLSSADIFIACDIPGPLDDPQGANGWAGVMPTDAMAPVLDDPQGANGWAGVVPNDPMAPILDDPQGANGWAGVLPTDPMIPALDDPQGANGWAGFLPQAFYWESTTGLWAPFG